ncbi:MULTISPECIES: dUTP diphosphatase [Kocuria]|uniref:dUTP diphosphatase n=2 Tax=Micrococcaceae TaxID=1268 RepID=UPI000B96B831|nr:MULTISPECIES: dUTP diphosphatase [Kocuria]RUP84818.1 dUTP diphosphatase [Kocuria sp. HSID17590]RUQ05031.1 dUTP diphosphatase [Kocuria sp. HSID17582]
MTDVREPATVSVALQLLDTDLPAPAYARPGDAGADLRARHDVTLAPGERALVDTGVAVAIPEGYVGLVHPRSGLAAKHGITVLNAPGTVDSGYRGELKVCLLNTDRSTAYTVRRGERIAQLLLQEVATARFETVAQLPSSERGERGFGSSGTH